MTENHIGIGEFKLHLTFRTSPSGTFKVPRMPPERTSKTETVPVVNPITAELALGLTASVFT